MFINDCLKNHLWTVRCNVSLSINMFWYNYYSLKHFIYLSKTGLNLATYILYHKNPINLNENTVNWNDSKKKSVYFTKSFCFLILKQYLTVKKKKVCKTNEFFRRKLLVYCYPRSQLFLSFFSVCLQFSIKA